MPNILSKKEAVSFLGLDAKVFDNFFLNAGEFPCLPRPTKGARYKFDQGQLRAWKEDYRRRTVVLNFDDYLLCLDFALAQHFRGYVGSDWGTTRQREFGQKITNWMKGQLGELAVKKFLQKEFGVEVELDFDIHPQIVPQDITAVVENGVRRDPKIGVGIKASKPKSAFLILDTKDTRAERRSDIYIYCRPDIPDDHLLRLTRDTVVQLLSGKPLFSTYMKQIPTFDNIPCEVVGWCRHEELDEVTAIPGQEFSNGVRYVKKSGELHKSSKDWKKLIELL